MSDTARKYFPARRVSEEISNSFPLTVSPCSVIDSVSCAISFTNPNLSAEDYGCVLGENVEWVRRFPSSGEGFLIKIEDSPTKEF